jgi:hypothetical protein
MDRRQTYDVVDTPPPDRRNWPALEDFQEREEIIKWRDIQPGTYKVLELHNQGRNNYGPSVVLKLEHANGTTIFVWAPSSLVYAMEKRKCTNFILNLGAKRSEETGNIFYDFKLC